MRPLHNQLAKTERRLWREDVSSVQTRKGYEVKAMDGDEVPPIYEGLSSLLVVPMV